MADPVTAEDFELYFPPERNSDLYTGGEQQLDSIELHLAAAIAEVDAVTPPWTGPNREQAIAFRAAYFMSRRSNSSSQNNSQSALATASGSRGQVQRGGPLAESNIYGQRYVELLRAHQAANRSVDAALGFVA